MIRKFDRDEFKRQETKDRLKVIAELREELRRLKAEQSTAQSLGVKPVNFSTN